MSTPWTRPASNRSAPGSDKKKSGATADRSGIIDVLDRLRHGDVLVVYILDRLGTTGPDVLNHVHQLRQVGIGVRTLADAIPISTSRPGDPASELAIVLLSLLARMDCTCALERAAHARAVREQRGQRTGPLAANTEQNLDGLAASTTSTSSRWPRSPPRPASPARSSIGTSAAWTTRPQLPARNRPPDSATDHRH